MKLIHFQGLNCYHDCLITLANAFGINYLMAFSRLWSESDMRYDPICNIFLSRRLEETLESIGMKLSPPCITKREREIEWTDTPSGNYIIFGMDTCFIPWSPLYQLLHGPHYFIVQKGNSEFHTCFDPTYKLSDQKLTTQELILNAYALISIKMQNPAIPFIENTHDSLLEQSYEVLKVHPETLCHFLEQIDNWKQNLKKTVLFPAKYVDTLLTGRYLYKYFLSQQQDAAKRAPLFFSKPYYKKWLTVKNGFYKAALTSQNSSSFNESCSLLTSLFEQELELAKQIISIESKHSKKPFF